MKLLIITQKVDYTDDNLGFFHDWLVEFSRQVEKLTVICLDKGKFDLPRNVQVLSLGKEKGTVNCKLRIVNYQLNRVRYLCNFYRFIWRYRRDYDKVFVHMNPEYIVLAGWLWKLTRKKIYLWYTHKRVSWQLRLAEKFADRIFTASARSFRLPSAKLKVMGHGIDTERFKPAEKEPTEKIILTVGRISPTKQIRELIGIFSKLREKMPELKLRIVGSPIYEKDKEYLAELRALVSKNNLENSVIFVGSVVNRDLPSYYHQASLFINLSQTGSLDKVVLEAMACNVPVITTNEAFAGIVPERCYVEKLDDVADRGIGIIGANIDYRSIVTKSHSLEFLIKKLIKEINEN